MQQSPKPLEWISEYQQRGYKMWFPIVWTTYNTRQSYSLILWPTDFHKLYQWTLEYQEFVIERTISNTLHGSVWVRSTHKYSVWYEFTPQATY